MIELDPVDRITAGAVGEPGQRVFFLQGRQSERLVTILVEKQQVELLSASLVEILARSGKETGRGPSDEEMDLEEPVEPVWRAGRLSIGYEQDRDLILLELVELVPEQEEEPDEPIEVDEELELDAERLRLWATREQMLALSRHGAAVVARGRPTCQFCGNPIDPEGHRCPAMNGHRA